MIKGIFEVIDQTEVSYLYEAEFENGRAPKCDIKLKEFGGDNNGDEFICTLWDDLAELRFSKGDLVVASLKFSISFSFKGTGHQLVTIKNIHRL